MTLADRIQTLPYKRLEEPRGWFQKPLTGKDSVPDSFGEIYAVQALKGEIRGNHYHEKAVEWFFVLAGSATVYLQDVDTGEKEKKILTADEPTTLVIHPRVAHAFVNENEEPFILVAYTDVLFDPVDTIPFELAKKA